MIGVQMQKTDHWKLLLHQAVMECMITKSMLRMGQLKKFT